MHTPHRRDTPADLHLDTQSHSQMLHTYPQGHNCPQTHMVPDKPPPTGVCTPQHRRPHLHIHFLTGILPPSCTTPGGIIHIACFLNGAPWSCAVHSQHNCTWMPCTHSCGLASIHTHTHRVTDTWRYTLRFTCGLTHTSGDTHPPGTAPHTDSPALSTVYTLTSSIDTLVRATPDRSYWDTPHSPPSSLPGTAIG